MRVCKISGFILLETPWPIFKYMRGDLEGIRKLENDERVFDWDRKVMEDVLGEFRRDLKRDW